MLTLFEFEMVSVAQNIPETSGEYIIITKTKMGRKNTFNSSVKIDGDTINWGCNNQIVTHWLKPIFMFK